MKNTVHNLRPEWYGNCHLFLYNLPFMVDHGLPIIQKNPVDCSKLFLHAMKMANKKCVPMCDGMQGVIGNLFVDEGHNRVEGDIPIDFLIEDITNTLELDDDDDLFSTKKLKKN